MSWKSDSIVAGQPDSPWLSDQAVQGRDADIDTFPAHSPGNVTTNANRAFKSFVEPLEPTRLSPDQQELEKARRFYSLREGVLQGDLDLRARADLEYGPDVPFSKVNQMNQRYADKARKPVEVPDFSVFGTPMMSDSEKAQYDLADRLPVTGSDDLGFFLRSAVDPFADLTTGGMTITTSVLSSAFDWGSKIMPIPWLRDQMKAESIQLQKDSDWWRGKRKGVGEGIDAVLNMQQPHREAMLGSVRQQIGAGLGSTAGYIGLGKVIGGKQSLGLYLQGQAQGQPGSRAVGISMFAGLQESAYENMIQAGYSKENARDISLMYAALWTPLEMQTWGVLSRGLPKGGVGKAILRKWVGGGVPQGMLQMGETWMNDWLAGNIKSGAHYFQEFLRTSFTSTIASGAIGYAGTQRQIGHMARTMTEQGLPPDIAQSTAERLQRTKSEKERTEIVDELMRNPDAVKGMLEYNLRQLAEANDLSKEAQSPFTLGEANAIRQTHSDAEINQRVSQMDSDVQDAGRDALMNPTEQTVDAYNDALLPEVDPRLEIHAADVAFGREIYEISEIYQELSDSEFVQLVAESVAYMGGSSGMTEAQLAELGRRAENDQSKLRTMVRMINKESGRIAKADEGRAPSIGLPELHAPTIRNRAARMEERGWHRFQEALGYLESRLLRSDGPIKGAAKWAEKTGVTLEQATEFLRREDARRLRNDRADQFAAAVKAGDADRIRALIADINTRTKGRGIASDGVFAQKMLAAAGDFQLAKRIDMNESNMAPFADSTAEAPAAERAPVEQAFTQEAPAELTSEGSADRAAETYKAQVKRNPVWFTDQGMEILNRAEALARILVDQTGVSEWQLSESEKNLVSDYVAYMQGYEGVREVQRSELSEQSDVILTQIQQVLEQTIAEMEAINAAGILEIPFHKAEGFYFPMATQFHNAAVPVTLEQFIDAHAGFTKRRNKSPDFIRDPVGQIVKTMNDRAVLLETARSIIEQRERLLDRQTELADIAEKVSQDQALSEEESALVDEASRYNESLEAGNALGIESPADFSRAVLRNIALRNAYGEGVDMNLKLSTITDAPMVVPRMDQTRLDDIPSSGWGPNSHAYREWVLSPQAQLKSMRIDDQFRAATIMSPLIKAERYSRINIEMWDHLLNKKESRTEVFRAVRRMHNYGMSDNLVNSLAQSLDVSPGLARGLMSFGEMMLEYYGDLAANPDLQSDYSKISQDRRIRFRHLESLVMEGSATEADIAEYMAFSPQLPLAGKKSILRNTARFLFERQAIDSRDFFAYFDALQEGALKARHFGSAVKNINAWADYLERQGQANNAAWWRDRVEIGIKGNAFAFEDTILSSVANALTEGTEAVIDRYGLDGNIINTLSHTTPDRMKLRMAEALRQLQTARVNSWLAGNYGWTLWTQPLSTLFTLKNEGLVNLVQGAFSVLTKTADLTDSDVVAIKAFRTNKEAMSAFAAGEFENMGTRATFRRKLRNVVLIPQSLMEAGLTKISYSAALIRAKKLGMNDADASLYADFSAATAQGLYDRAIRNMATNSDLLRAASPMQSYAFTAMGQLLNSLNVVGVEKSRVQRAQEMLRFIVGAQVMSWLWSIIFGQDWIEALYDPKHAKTTVGSNIPIIGQEIDSHIRKNIPWVSDGWDFGSPSQQFFRSTYRLKDHTINKWLSGEPASANWDRELMEYLIRYVTPFMGVPGTVPMSNLITMTDAAMKGGRVEDITGRRMYDFEGNDNPAMWIWGTMHGRKAIEKKKK